MIWILLSMLWLFLWWGIQLWSLKGRVDDLLWNVRGFSPDVRYGRVALDRQRALIAVQHVIGTIEFYSASRIVQAVAHSQRGADDSDIYGVTVTIEGVKPFTIAAASRQAAEECAGDLVAVSKWGEKVSEVPPSINYDSSGPLFRSALYSFGVVGFFGFLYVFSGGHGPRDKDLDADVLCRKSESLMREGMARTLGSASLFQGNMCSEKHLITMGDGRALVVAAYRTRLGVTPYTVLFSPVDTVACESVGLECVKRPDVTKLIQDALVEKGFDPGPVDGVWGPNTVRALRAFGASVGLSARNANTELMILALLTGTVMPIR